MTTVQSLTEILRYWLPLAMAKQADSGSNIYCQGSQSQMVEKIADTIGRMSYFIQDIWRMTYRY